MIKKVELLSKMVNEISYDKMKREDYILCGFTHEEADKCMNIYYSLCGVGEWVDKAVALEFCSSVLEYTTDLIIRYYFLCFIVMHTNKDKYHYGKMLVELVCKNRENIYNFKEDILVERETLNFVLNISSTMNIYLLEVVDIVYNYISCTKDIICFTHTIAHALKRANNEQISNKFQELYILIVKSYIDAKEAFGLNGLMDKLKEEKNQFFDYNIIQSPLNKIYFELGQEGKGLREIAFLQKAIEGFHFIGDQENEQKALGVLQDTLENNEIGWHESYIEIPEEIQNKIQRNIERLLEHLDKSGVSAAIKDVDKYIAYRTIDDSGKIIANEIIYEPFPIYETIIESESGSITSQICSTMALRDNRISSTGERDKRMFKDIFYSNGIKVNVLPFMKWVDSHGADSLIEIRSLIKNSKFADDEIYNYYLRTEKYYTPESAFEFIHLAVILIEKTLRQLYKEVKGTSITTQKRNTQAQFNVNLQDIMKDEGFKRLLGEDLYHYIEYILVDDEGINLRNNALHGFMKIDDYHFNYSRILMHVILLIFNLEVDKNEKQIS